MTKSNVYHAILTSKLKYPDIVFAQAMLESGDLGSKLTKTNNNVFGMKLPVKRTTLAVGELNGHALYFHWLESVQDYKIYQEYIIKTRHIKNRYSYIRYLNRTYSAVHDYSKRLKRVIKENMDVIKTSRSIQCCDAGS